MEDWTSHYNSGITAFRAGDYDTAVTELEVASRGNHEDYKIFNALGAAYAGKGLYEKAIGAFKAAEQISPDIARIHYNIAQAYEAIGILNEADYEYQKALEIDPAYVNAEQALMTLRSRASRY